MTTPFRLDAPYQPAGDQPAAIDKLVAGVNAGLANQTILGVTGSGKSVVGDTKVLLNAGGRYYHVRIDSIAGKFPQLPEGPDVTQYVPLDKGIQTLALDTQTGDVALRDVTEMSRHRYDGDLYTVTTEDGRSNVFTDSHNVFAIRNGSLELVRSADLRVGDRIPLPILVPPSPTDSLEWLDVTEWIEGDGVRVHLSPCHDISGGLLSHEKMYRVRKRGESVSLAEFKALDALKNTVGANIGTCSKRAQLPVKISISNNLLRFVGVFIAEGHVGRSCVSVSTGDSSIIDEITTFAVSLGLSIRKSKSRAYDYMIGGTTLSLLMKSWCGAGSAHKHLPAFWPQLNNQQLGILLSGVFAGDGCAEKNTITLCSVSKELVSDVQLALARFGILSRVRAKKGRYKGEEHWSWVLSISGKSNCRAFKDNVGFGLLRKDVLVDALCARDTVENTNVDVMPLPLGLMSSLVDKYGIYQREIGKAIGVCRPLVSMYFGGLRHPSRKKAKAIADFLMLCAQKNEDIAAELELKKYAALTDVAWSPVKSIVTKKADTVVYDLSVPDCQTFLANGYFVHNTFTAAHVIARTGLPTIVLAPNKTLAAQLYGEFKSFFPDNAVEYFVSYYDYYQPEAYIPSSDTFIDKDAQINEQIEQMRLSATKALLERRDVIVVASVSAIYGLGDPNEFLKMALHLKVGDKMGQRELLARLTEIQYARNDVELQRATFRVRGETIDVFPAEHDHHALRIRLFDGEIEALSLLDPLTGQQGKKMTSYALFPKSHYVTTRERTLAAIDSIGQELEERLIVLKNENKLVEMQRLEQRTRYDLEMIREVGYCNGIENYSRHLTGQKPGDPPPTLFSYLPKDALLIVDEAHVTVPQVGGMFKADRSRKETLVNFGFRLPSAMDNRPLNFAEWEARIPRTIFVSATPGAYELEHTAPEDIVELVVRPTGLLDPTVEVRPVATQVDDLLSEITKRVALGDRVLVTTLTKKMSENLTDYLMEHGVKVRYLHSDIETLECTEILRDLRLGVFDVLVGINLLREGLDLPEVSLVAILDADKEGFLRSYRSLIQTIGRAARNARGTAILYADKITNSMQLAMDETARRRDKQIAHNLEQGITPTTINRRVADVMEGLRSTDDDKGSKGKKGKKGSGELPPDKDLSALSQDPVKMGKELAKLDKTMRAHAKNLEFEEAAAVRDKMERLRNAILLNPGV